MIEKARRTEDHGARAIAATVARSTSRTFWAWVEDHHIDSLAVIVLTLWLTIDVVRWAMQFAEDHYSEQGMHIAAIIGAVLTPWGIMQAALFKFYADLKGKSNGNWAAKP